jgi:zinc-ribbon domain
MTGQAFCPTCGAARVPGSRFCSSCGRPFEAEGVPAALPSVPPSPSLRRESRTAERIVGILIVVAVVGGAAVLLNRPASTPGAEAQPTRTSSPSARATVEPTTPEPLPLFGSGMITFGKDYDPDTLFIADETARFKTTYPEIAWSAELNRAIGATSIEWVLASQSASGTERVIWSQELDISNPDSDLLANKLDLAFFVDYKPGTYVMRYIESGEVLAEGTFTLVE